MDRKKMNELLGATEDQLDVWAEEYEKDTWNSSKLGKVVMGRPSIANEEVRPVTVRLPISQIVALDERAKISGKTRSSAIRSALDEWLLQAQ